MNRAVLLLTGLLPLSACNSEPEVDARNASVQEVAEEVRDATRDAVNIRPGKWLSQVTLEEVTAPGVPAQVREQMQGMFAGKQSYESCLTAEDVKRPKEDFFAGKDNKQCRYDHFRMGDGKIDARMRCSHEQMSQIMEFAGTYSPEAYQMRMSTKTEAAAGPASGMSMRMRVDAKRVGECDGKQA
jgi:hypothetical protein